MTAALAALAQAEIDRNHYRRALEAAQRDLQFIADALSRPARSAVHRAVLNNSAQSHAYAARSRVEKALRWEQDA